MVCAELIDLMEDLLAEHDQGKDKEKELRSIGFALDRAMQVNKRIFAMADHAIKMERTGGNLN